MELKLAVLLTLCCLATGGSHSDHHHGDDHDNHHGHNDHDHHNDIDSEEFFGSGDYHGTEVQKSEEAHLFIERLFHKYGKKGMMTFEGFEHLLHSLGIGQISIEDHDIHDHYSETGFVEFHEDHNHTSSKRSNDTDSGVIHDHEDDDHGSGSHDELELHHGDDEHHGNDDVEHQHEHHDHHHSENPSRNDKNLHETGRNRHRNSKKNYDPHDDEANEEHEGEGHVMRSTDEEVKGRVKRAAPDSPYLHPDDMPEAKKVSNLYPANFMFSISRCSTLSIFSLDSANSALYSINQWVNSCLSQ